MEWVNSAVDEFCRTTGLESNFATTARIQLLFEKSGLLNIEIVKDNLIIFLTRSIDWHRRSVCQIHALKLCHYDQGWPFLIRAGMLGQDSLVMSATIPLDQVTLPSIEQAFNLLSRLHDEIEDQ